MSHKLLNNQLKCRMRITSGSCEDNSLAWPAARAATHPNIFHNMSYANQDARTSQLGMAVETACDGGSRLARSAAMKPSRDIQRLIEIMAALRTPETGCPWDLKQDFATIAPYTIEEAYEVADAIARGDLDDLKDELGDLLLQVVFHARMAQEQGAFDFGDVVQAITEKLIRRHPHVFGDTRRPDAGRRSRACGTGSRPRKRPSARRRRGAGDEAGALAGIPAGLPALDPRAQAAAEGRQGRLRLERSARGAGQDPRGNRRDRSRARQRATTTRPPARSAT